MQAGILDERKPGADGFGVTAAILADPLLSSSQKRALLQVYASFCKENGHGPAAPPDDGEAKSDDH